jgi:hypothetical protein
MNKLEFLKNKLKYFVVVHPTFEGSEEDIFTPKKRLKIRFWIEGNLQIEGTYNNLELNFNSDDCLILALRDSNSNQSNIFRTPWERITSFELITNEDTDEELVKLTRITPNQRN